MGGGGGGGSALTANHASATPTLTSAIERRRLDHIWQYHRDGEEKVRTFPAATLGTDLPIPNLSSPTLLEVPNACVRYQHTADKSSRVGGHLTAEEQTRFPPPLSICMLAPRGKALFQREQRPLLDRRVLACGVGTHGSRARP